MSLSICALMLPNTVIPIFQCQPRILAKLWWSHLSQSILTVFVGTIVQHPHMRFQAQLACASAASLSISLTLTPRQLHYFLQQLDLSASTKSFQQLSVVTRIAVYMIKCSCLHISDSGIHLCSDCYTSFWKWLGLTAGSWFTVLGKYINISKCLGELPKLSLISLYF